MNIYLVAYLRYNLGDDLFLKIFQERYRNIKFKTIALNGYYRFKCDNIKFINSKYERILSILTGKKLFLHKKYIENADTIIILGGSMFIEEPKFNYINTIYNTIIKKNTYILGSNFGPYFSEKYLEYFSKFFLKCKDVCFRDNYSYNLFSKISSVRYAPDIVYSLAKDKLNIKENKNIIISVIDCNKKGLAQYKEIYENKIIEFMNYFTEHKYTVTLMSFCKAEGDEKTIKKIIGDKKVLNKENVKKYFYKGNIDEALEVISNSKAIVATRFHANILGLILNKSIISIAYSDKTINALKDIDYKGKIFDIRDSKFSQSVITLEDIEKKYKINIPQNAYDHFNKLDKLLLGEEIKNEKISIIIPTYNRKELLLECIKSIISQKYTNFEIIIVDDKSTDGTKNYITSNIKDKRIIYLENEQNKGAGYSRKSGYIKATGKYIIFCDDDDYYIDNNYFQDAINIFKNKEISMICSNTYIKFEKENKYKFKNLNIKNMIENTEYLKNFQFKYKKPNSTFSAIFRKECLEQGKIMDMEMVNDSSIYLRVLINKGKVFINNKIIGVYRVHSKNITFNIKPDFLIANMIEKKKIYEIIKENKIIKNAEKWLYNQIKLTYNYYISSSNPTKNNEQKVTEWIKENTNISVKSLKILKSKYKIKNIIKKLVRR